MSSVIHDVKYEAEETEEASVILCYEQKLVDIDIVESSPSSQVYGILGLIDFFEY